MDKRQRMLRGLWRPFAVALLTGAVIAAFFGIGEGYMRLASGDRTVVLDPAAIRAAVDDEFRLTGIVKRRVDGTLGEAKLLDGDSLLFHRAASGADGAAESIARFDIGESRVSDLVESPGLSESAVSPGGGFMIYSRYGKKGEQVFERYDLKLNRALDVWETSGYRPAMLDDYRYISLVGLEIRLHDIRTGRDDALAELTWPGRKERYLKPIGMKVAPERNVVYVQMMGGADRATIVLAANTAGGAVTEAVSGQIYDYAPLRGGALLVAGRIGGVEGMFIAGGSEAPVLLQKGVFSKLAPGPKRNTVAYVTRPGIGLPKLMVGRLTDRALEEATTLYDDPGFVGLLQWTADGDALIGVSEDSDGSHVYKFQFAGDQ